MIEFPPHSNRACHAVSLNKACVLVALFLQLLLTHMAIASNIHFDHDETGEVIAARYWGSPGDLARLKLDNYPKLATLDIVHFTTLNQADIDAIAKIQTLEELIFGQEAILGETVTLDGSAAVLGSLKRLKWLKVVVAEFNQRDWTFLSKLPRLEYLEVDVGEYFDAKECTLTDNFGKTLAGIKSLRDVSMHSASKLTETFTSNFLGEKSELESLVLTHGEFTDRSLQEIAGRCPKLTCLEIGGAQISDQGIEHLIKLTKLEHLTVESTNLTSASIRSASRIKSLTNVEFQVHEANVSDLQQLAALPNLERVIFRELSMSNEALDCFRDHPSLVSLFCDGQYLNQQKAVEFVRSLPHVEYVSFGPQRSKLQQAVSAEVKRIEVLRSKQEQP